MFRLVLMMSFLFGAAAFGQEVAHLSGKQVALHYDFKARLLISRSCLKSSGKFDCDAYRALKRLTLRNLEEKLEGGANPGAVACVAVGGSVVVSVDALKNETSYCKFADGSLVANGSVAARARLNDEAH